MTHSLKLKEFIEIQYTCHYIYQNSQSVIRICCFDIHTVHVFHMSKVEKALTLQPTFLYHKNQYTYVL